MKIEVLLHAAANFGSSDTVQALINRTLGRDGNVASHSTTVGSRDAESALMKMLKARDENGLNALMIACSNGRLSVVEVILDSFTEGEAKVEYINTSNDEGLSALWYATGNGHSDVFGLLIESGVDITDHDKLMVACVRGCQSEVESVLAIFPNDVDRLEFVNKRDSKGRSALWCATNKGHSEVMNVLIASGADVTVKDETAETMLIASSRAGHVAAVKSLLAAFTNENRKLEFVNYYKDGYRSTALFWAIDGGHCDVAGLLIEAGADVTLPGERDRTLLWQASFEGNAVIVKLLLATFTDDDKRKEFVNDRGSDCGTALSWAISRGHSDVVTLLRQAGAEITARDKYGHTNIWDVETIIGIFPDAEQQGTKQNRDCSDIGQRIAWSADATVRNYRDQTMLMALAEAGYLSEVKLLLASFTDDEKRLEFVNIRGLEGQSALWYAANRTHGDIMVLLMESGADVTVRNENDGTLLMVTPNDCLVPAFKALLATFTNDDERFAFVNARDRDGRSALWHATSHGHRDVVSLLLAYATVHDKLMVACALGHNSEVESVLALFPDAKERADFVNTANEVWQESALWFATRRGHSDVMELLLASDADVTVRDEEGCTMLMKASQGHVSAVKSLLVSFPDAEQRLEFVNICNNRGQSALSSATIYGRTDIMSLLIEAGADVAVRNKLGWPLLFHIRSSQGYLSAAKLLLAAFTDDKARHAFVNTRGSGRCAHLSAMTFPKGLGQFDMITLLIEAGFIFDE